jgi:hypothetical protein
VLISPNVLFGYYRNTVLIAAVVSIVALISMVALVLVIARPKKEPLVVIPENSLPLNGPTLTIDDEQEYSYSNKALHIFIVICVLSFVIVALRAYSKTGPNRKEQEIPTYSQEEIQELLCRYNKIYDQIHVGVEPNKPLQVFSQSLTPFSPSENCRQYAMRPLEPYQTHGLRAIHGVMMTMNHLGRMDNKRFFIPFFINEGTLAFDVAVNTDLETLNVYTLDVHNDVFKFAEEYLGGIEADLCHEPNTILKLAQKISKKFKI